MPGAVQCGDGAGIFRFSLQPPAPFDCRYLLPATSRSVHDLCKILCRPFKQLVCFYGARRRPPTIAYAAAVVERPKAVAKTGAARTNLPVDDRPPRRCRFARSACKTVAGMGRAGLAGVCGLSRARQTVDYPGENAGRAAAALFEFLKTNSKANAKIDLKAGTPGLRRSIGGVGCGRTPASVCCVRDVQAQRSPVCAGL